VWCGVLGPLTVRGSAGEPLTISGPARRLLFAALVSRAGRTVPPDVLVEDLWGHVPPRTAAKTLQSHVVRLRDDLGRDPALVTDRAGYRLELGPEDVDAGCFEASVRRAAQRSAAGDPAGALGEFDAALALRRGDAYEEFADAPFCVSERLRLFEMRAHAEEERTDAALALGQSGELVADLEKRLDAAPYRERTWEQLVLALYRAGRQADALGAYGRARRTLADDLGVDPGPRLQQLEQQVLRQDPALIGVATTARPVAVVRPRPGVCPYRGLASYREGDGDLFVGRERLTAEVVGMLADNHVLAVVGASGTGKSSLLRAGLVPALRRGALPGSAAWRVTVLTPADALAETSVGAADVLVLDQAEDLFGQLGAAQRAEVVDRLAQFVGAGSRLVFALRADFYRRLTEVQPLAAYAQAATVLVGPLREDDLRRVVIEPAERLGLAIEPALVDAVLDDVAGQPAALPLLSAALVRTWENRIGNRLTLDGYRRGGGVASALEATAEDAYDRLPEHHRLVARRLLVRLAVREGGSWVRRPMRRSDATADADAREVLAALAAARLVTVGQERVEITHDALLAHWPRLRSWLDERAMAAELLDHLGVAARAWAEADRPASDLYRGPRLQTALDWRDAHPDDVSAVEARFLDASAAAADAELVHARERAQREARGRRRLRLIAAGLAVMVVLAAVGIVVAFHERSSANSSARRARAAALSADARRLAALSANAPDIATSSLLAVAAYRLQDSADTRGALLDAVERSQSALWRIQAVHRLQWVATDPAGDRVATIDNRGRVFVYDTRTRRQIASFPSNSQLLTGISGDGRQVVVSGGDSAQGNQLNPVSVLDVATGKRRHVFATDADLNIWEPVMSQDGHWIAMVTTRHVGAGVAVDVYDMRDWAAPARTVVSANPTAIAVSRNALAVQAASGTVTVWSLPSMRVLGHAHAVHPATHPTPMALTPDGDAVAVVDGADPTESAVYSTHTAHVTALPAQPEGIETLGFSPDGAELVIGSIIGSLNTYRTSDGAQLESYAGDVGTVMAVSWSGTTRPTGLYTAGLDSQLASWSIGVGPRLLSQRGPDLEAPDRSELFGHVALGLTPQFSSPATERGYAVDVRSGRFETWPLHLGNNGSLNQAVASWDGRRALLSIEDGAGENRIVIWDLVANRQVGQLHLPDDAPRVFDKGMDAGISPNGALAY
jgi:DNA-binding SARP family transcriptional activator/WD40 repeat protein